MRFLWICNPALSPMTVKSSLNDLGAKYVSRIMTFKHRLCWAFITDADTADFAAKNALDDLGNVWSITACNKQYVMRLGDGTERGDGRYLGCLGNVVRMEAEAWIDEDDANWYLRDSPATQFWIPMKRNPNRFIPTRSDDQCPQCGAPVDAPIKREPRGPQPIYRPWPLLAFAANPFG